MNTRSFILAIEISNPGAETEHAAAGNRSGPGVALGRIQGDEVLSIDVEPVRLSGRGGQDDDLMPAIDRLCRRAGFHPSSGGLARVAVSIGPGGYTSVRVACAAGKMIAEAAGAACVAVLTANVVHDALPLDLRSAPVAIALASKNDSAWVQVFSGNAEPVPGRLMTSVDIPTLREMGIRTLVADRFLPAAMREAVQHAGLVLRPPVFDAAACVRVGARLPAIDPALLVPLYPREPDAVTLWRAKMAR
jgi:tRNA threonylcarbamoyladenosine biosynthesis protein TsaB